MISKYYSPPSSRRKRFSNFRPPFAHKIAFWSAIYSACVVYTKTIIQLSVDESDTSTLVNNSSLNIPQFSKLARVEEKIRRIINTIASIWGENMLGYLFLDVICSTRLAVSLEVRSRKTVRFSEQIMSADKYPGIIFAPNGGYIVYLSSAQRIVIEVAQSQYFK